MPPKNIEHGSTQTAIRGKRPMPTHIVPAIPFALSKPKISRRQPKASNDVMDQGAQSATSHSAADHLSEAIKPGGKSAGSQPEPESGSQAAQKPGGDDDGGAVQGTLLPPTLNEDIVERKSGVEASSGVQAVRDYQPPSPPPTDEGLASSPTITSSPETVRKPTDRFDIRQLRTDFPPVFIPAVEQQTPQSATSSLFRPQFSNRPPAHPHHPSVGSIVFGGRESSASSPAPPHSAASAFVPPSHVAQAAPGHAYHASEPHVPRAHHPAHPPTAPWTMRHAPGPTVPHPQFTPIAHAPFRYPQRETLTPVPTPHLNGYGLRSRDGSESSSTAALDGRPGHDLQSPLGFDLNSIDESLASSNPKNAFSSMSRQHATQFFPPPPHHFPPPFQNPELAAGYENLEALRGHLLNSFNVPDLADCRLQILDKRTGTQQSLLAHRMILARSPRLLQTIRDNRPPTSSTTHIDVTLALDGKYLCIPALLDAIRYLYGGPLPPLDPYHSRSSTAEAPNPSEGRMQSALQCIAVSTWLHIPAIIHKAVEVAASLLQWDSLATLLSFALEGGLSPVWTMEDGGVERVSTCSSDDSWSKPDTVGAPVYDPHSTYLLHRIISFIVHTLPPNFYLDTSAPQLFTSPRLPITPHTHQSRPSRSDPRLSKIRFGEAPAEDHQRPSPATTTISSILLSLPLPLLKPLLEHHDLTHRLGPETVSSIMRSVIQEREVRRQRAVQEYTSNAQDDGADAHLVHNLYWVESVEPSHHHHPGCRLARRRRGIDTPPSSGTESDRHR